MQETWCGDPREVEKEIRRLIAEKVPVTFYQPGHPPQEVLAYGVIPQKCHTLLVLRKKNEFTASGDAGLLLYKQANNPTRGFRATPILETHNDIGVVLPISIFWMQRRKHQRYAISNTSSSVTFSRHGGQALIHGKLEDLSMEGARMTGKFSQNINNGDVLCPLSLTLRLHFGNFEEKIAVGEAIVRRATDRGPETRELGIQFLLRGGDEQEKLERYISLCDLQAGSAKRKGG